MVEAFLKVLLIGIGATALLDGWAWLLGRFFGQPKPNWAMVGRWFAHLARGKVMHEDIGRSEPVENELRIGWIAHYAVGVLFALFVVMLAGTGWLMRPTLLPALIVGWLTIGCGWFILQPGMGAGIAASKRPNANQLRMLNILGHTVFGLGLWLAAVAVA